MDDTEHKMLNFCISRLVKLDENLSGFYDYYTRRIKKDYILNEDDHYLINYIQTHFDSSINIHEIACGIAQVTHYLALKGFNTSATDINKKRYECAVELGKAINSNNVINFCDFRNYDYKNINLIICVNGIHSIGFDLKSDYNFIIKHLEKGINFLIKVDKQNTKNPEYIKNFSNVQFLENNFVLLRGYNVIT